jgi:Flp pilus assembly pilin Flp
LWLWSSKDEIRPANAGRSPDGTSGHSAKKEGREEMRKWMKRLLGDERGQDLVEYSLILAFVALAAAALMTTMGTSVTTIWTSADSQMSNAAAAVPAP